MSPTARKVLLLSPLPPPAGGIATWTRTLLDAGLPGYVLDIVDVRLGGGRQLHQRPSFGIAELRRTLRILRDLRRKLKYEPPDLVHLNCSLSSTGIWRDLASVLLCRLAGIPVVTCYHGDVPGFLDRTGTVSRRGFRRIVRGSKQNVALNSDSEKLLLDLKGGGQPAVRLIPNFIPDDVLTRGNHEYDHKERLQVIFVGAISHAKGCHIILQVARELPELDFVLIGSMAGDFRRDASNLPSNVKTFTEAPHAEVLSALVGSDIFLFPSFWREGFPLSLLEAMAVGLPVVASNVGAIPEMLDQGSGGSIVRPDDREAIVTALRRLAGDPDLRRSTGTYNRDKVQRCYSYGVVSRQWLDLYESML